MTLDLGKGWKTRIVAGATALLGLVGFLDPNILTVALDLDARGHAILLVSLGLTMWLLREVTDSPAGKRE